MRGSLPNIIQSGIGWLYERRRKLATAGVGCLACVLAYHVVFGANGLVVYGHKRQEHLELQRQIESLQHQNQGLEQQIKALKSDPQAIEKEAREHLRYTRPGEVVFTVPTRPVGTASPAKK